MKLEQLHLNEGQIKDVPTNPRQITDAEFAKLKKSLKGFREMLTLRPIVVDEDYNILGGNMRYRALCRLAEEHVKIGAFEFTNEIPDEWVKVAHLTPKQKREFIIKDNGERGEWDVDVIANEWDSAEIAEWDVDVPTYDNEEEPKQAQEDDFDEGKDMVATRCNRGDVWQLGEHRLMCGDSTDADAVGLLMGGESAQLLMTDPPYGISAEKMTLGAGKKEFHRGDWDSTRPDISLGIAITEKQCIWGGNYFADKLPVTNDWLCWHKKNDGRSFSEFELAWTNFGHNCRILSHHWSGEVKLHPTMKPVAVIDWAIKQSDTDGNVLDLFGGSGSTMIACEQLGRKCYMMELDQHYCDVIIARWEKLTGQKAIKLN